MAEKKEKLHSFTLNDRRTMTLQGVTDTERFEDKTAVIYTEAGVMTVKGRQLKLGELSMESGELTLTGEIDSITYGDRDRRKKSTVLGKLTR